jgi:hypothetical protein
MNTLTKKYYVRELRCNICGNTGTEEIVNMETRSKAIVCVACAELLLNEEKEQNQMSINRR